MASKVRFLDNVSVSAYGSSGGGGDSISSSYATTASYTHFATSASHAEYAVSASYEIIKEVSSSHANTADVAGGLQGQPSIYVTNITASGDISSSGDIQGGSLTTDQYIYHKDNNITYLNFTENRLRFNIGGVSYIDLNDNTGPPRDITFNDGGNNIDLTIKGSSNNPLFKTDANLNRIGTNGQGSPSADFHIGGNLKVQTSITASNISASGNIYGDILQIDKGSTFNVSQNSAYDFIVKSLNYNRMLYVDTNKDKVGIGYNSPGGSDLSSSLHIAGDLTVNTNITASGNISASGTGSFANLQLPNNGRLDFGAGFDQFIRGYDDTIIVDGDNSIFLYADNYVVLSSNIVKNNAGSDGGILAWTGSISITGSGNTQAPKTLTVEGDISASGNITATTYYGDGSNLTGVSAGLWSGSAANIRTNNAATVGITGSLSLSGSLTASGDISSSGDITLGHTTKFSGYVAGTTQYMFTNQSYQPMGGYSLGFLIATGSDIGGTAVKISGSSEGSFVGIGVPYTTPLTKALTVQGDISASGNIRSTRFEIDGASHYIDKAYDDSLFLVTTGDVAMQPGTGKGLTVAGDISTTGATGHITASGNISASGDIFGVTGSFDYITIGDKISREGDPDTKILFTDDDINITVGGVNMVDLTQDTVSEVTWNEAGADLDYRIESVGDTKAFYINAGQNSIQLGSAATTHITASGNISSSATSTASFGTYLGDGSQLTGIETDPFPYTGDVQITGSLTISGSDAIDLTVEGGLKIISSSTNTLIGLTIENQGTPTSAEGYGAGIKLISGPGTAPTITGSIFVKDDSGGGANPYHPALVLNTEGGGIYLKSEGTLQNSEMIRLAGGSSQRTSFNMYQVNGNMSHYNMVVNNGGNTSTRILMGQPSSGYYMEAGAAGSTYSYTIGTHGGNTGTFTPYTIINTNGYQILSNVTASGNISSSATSTASFGTYLGDGSQLTGIEAGTNLTQSIFVTQNGNDLTGTVGDISKPFATLNSASQAATTGSTIFVYPGTYTAEAENLAFEGGSYYFYPGTVVSKSAAGPVFASTTLTEGFDVFGHADFYLTGSSEEVLEAGYGVSAYISFSYTFECQDITLENYDSVTQHYAIVSTVHSTDVSDYSTANIKVRDITSDGSGIGFPGPVNTRMGVYNVDIRNLHADFNGIYSYQGVNYLDINANRIVTNQTGIYLYYCQNVNINVNYLEADSSYYGVQNVGSGTIKLNGYINSIKNNASLMTLTGHCAKLDTDGGTFIGTSFEGTGTWSGGNNDVKLTPTYTEFLYITGGNHRINAGGSSNYFPYISIQGGLTYIDGYQTSGNSNYNYNISGGELIWDGHMKFSTNDNGQNFPFNLSGGVLRIKGHVENSLMDSEPTPQEYSCVYYNGGTLILDGATLLTSASFAPPVRVVGQDREVKIYSGGVNTNKTGSLGLLAASSSFGSGGYALTNPLGGMIIEDSSVE